MIEYDEKKLKSHHHGYVRRRETNPITRIEYTYEQVMDVLSLVAHKKWPDGQMSDDECTLWEVIHRELDIPIPW